jgi:hypothetical protein
MAPQGLIESEACFIGIRAEQNAPEANSDHASRIPKYCLQQKDLLLSKDKLRQRCILEEVYRKHFPDVPLALPPFPLPIDIPSKADATRAPTNIVPSRSTEARDFERHATQRGCNVHSPELTVWTELCHVPSAPQPVLAWGNVLF